VRQIGTENRRAGVARDDFHRHDLVSERFTVTPTTASPRFQVRCRDCGRTILRQVEWVTEVEERELRRHLVDCRPDLVIATSAGRGLGPLLARFEVATTGNGA